MSTGNARSSKEEKELTRSVRDLKVKERLFADAVLSGDHKTIVGAWREVYGGGVAMADKSLKRKKADSLAASRLWNRCS